MNNAIGRPETFAHNHIGVNKHDSQLKIPKTEHVDGTKTTAGPSSSSTFVDRDTNEEVEWRRTWQPGLRCCPWRVLQADHYVYLVKANFLPDSYEFLITDLNHFWYESIKRTEFLKKLQDLNPNLEAPTSKILDHIKTNLEQNSENLSISKEESLGRLHLWINSDLAGFPFYWQMIGEAANEEMVSENTTIPLLMMVSELFRRQKELVEIINEKDKEIENYKAQDCKVTKKNLATVPFDETVFERSMISSQQFEDNVKLLGTTAFERSGQDLYTQVMTKYSWLNRTPKIEPAWEADANRTETVESDETVPSTERPSSTIPSWIYSLPPSLSEQMGITEPKHKPQESPTKVLSKSASTSTEKDETSVRRELLQQKLVLEEQKKEEKKRKKRKLAL